MNVCEREVTEDRQTYCDTFNLTHYAASPTFTWTTQIIFRPSYP